MKSLYCSHCGSRNHQGYDCADQSATWTPPPEVAAEIARQEVERKPTPVTMSVFEPTPRWPGAPKVCTRENLLSFQNEGVAAKWRAVNCPHASVEKSWMCEACCGLHFACYFVHGSSGKRLAELPQGFIPFQREAMRLEAKERVREIQRRGIGRLEVIELPGDKPAKAGAKRKAVVLPKRKEIEQKGLF